MKPWRRTGGGVAMVATNLVVTIEGDDFSAQWSSTFVPTSWEVQHASDAAFTVNLEDDVVSGTADGEIGTWTHGLPMFYRLRPLFGSRAGDWTATEAQDA